MSPLRNGILVLMLGLSAPLAQAEEWHVCVITSNAIERVQGFNAIHWWVNQPIEVSSTPDWNAQFNALRPEFERLAAARGLALADGSLGCSEGLSSLSAARERRDQMRGSFNEYLRLKDMGLASFVTWEDLAWVPSGAAAVAAPTVNAPEAATTASSESDGESANGDAATADRTDAKPAAPAPAEPTKASPSQSANVAKPTPKPAPTTAPKPQSAASEFRPDTSTCVSPPVVGPNKACGKGSSAFITNQCRQPVDVRMCLMTPKGWDCGARYGLVAGESWSWASCSGTEQVFTSSRYSDRSEPLKQP